MEAVLGFKETKKIQLSAKKFQVSVEKLQVIAEKFQFSARNFNLVPKFSLNLVSV